MRKYLRAALTAILVLLLIASAARLLYQYLQYQVGEDVYAEAELLAGLPEVSAPAGAAELTERGEEAQAEEVVEADAGEAVPESADPYVHALQSMDFTALREVNPEVLGWIMIPGTSVSYPLMQGTDNQYYLKHTWKGVRSAVGAIFLESTNSQDLSDFNTIVYGHRMNNGSMFASLKYYRTQSYWEQHPYVYLTDDHGSHRYEIFAAYEADTAGETYRLGFSQEGSRQSFLDASLEQSVIDTGVIPTVQDRILTLSTCTGRGYATRWVVQAVLRGAALAEELSEELLEDLSEELLETPAV